MAVKKTENPQQTLPALIPNYTSFVPANIEHLEISGEAIDMIDDKDYEGFEDTRDILPFVSIRQKPQMSDDGKDITAKPGGFKYQDPVIEVGDVDGDTGLLVSFLTSRTGRTLWEKDNNEKPMCKSIDGQTGVGNPGGSCLQCPAGRWGEHGEKPQCNQEMNLLCLDHSITKGNPLYILKLGRSGLKPWGNFRRLAKTKTYRAPGGMRPIPIHFMKVLVTTKYESDPLPHFIPIIQIIETASSDVIKLLKDTRESFSDSFNKTVEQVDVAAEEDQTIEDTEAEVVGSELPPGVASVEPISTEDLMKTGDDEGIPF